MFDETIDFDSRCANLSCLTNPRGAEIVDAVLPGDHALALGPNVETAIRFQVFGGGDGQAVAITLRCDENTAIALEGQPLPATARWTRWSQVQRAPVEHFESRGALAAGSNDRALGLSVAGAGRCYIDRFRLVTSGTHCAERAALPECCSYQESYDSSVSASPDIGSFNWPDVNRDVTDAPEPFRWDVAPDVSRDAAFDASTDATTDASEDATSDVSNDALDAEKADGAADAAPDGHTDAGDDSGLDAAD